MKALVMLIVEPKKIEEVCKEIARIKEVECVYEITGDYDVFLELEVNSMEEFREVLVNKILKINGIRSSYTSIVVGEWKLKEKY